MRVSDIKQSLWYLCGGLVVCSGVVVAAMTWFKKPVSRAEGYDKWAKSEMVAALKVDSGAAGVTNEKFDAVYPSTFGAKIDGIAPPPPKAAPSKRDPGPAAPPPKRPLSDFIVLSAVFGEGVQYRLRQGDTGVFEVGLGYPVPQKHASISPEAKLVAIKVKEFPIQVVFKVRDEDEVLLVPRDDITMQRPVDEGEDGEPEYTGPGGRVSPMARTVEPAIKRHKDGGYVMGREMQSVIRNDSNNLLKGIAWDQTDKGIRITKIRKGSLADQMLSQVKALGGNFVQERDIVVSVNGVKVKSKAQILGHFRTNPVEPGGAVKVEIWRNGRTETKVVRVPSR